MGGRGQRWWWRVTAAQQAKVHFSLLGCRTKYINPVCAGVPRWPGVFVVGVTQAECEPLRGAAPRGVVVARQLSPASRGLLELCIFFFLWGSGERKRERERVSVCARMWMCKRLKEKHSLS